MGWPSKPMLHERSMRGSGTKASYIPRMLFLLVESTVMKTRANWLGMCFDWRVLIALFAVGVAIAVVMPQLTLSLLPVLLLAACSLSMILMMSLMNRTDQKLVLGSFDGVTSSSSVYLSLSRQEQIAQLQTQLQHLQRQQDLIASQINALKQPDNER